MFLSYYFVPTLCGISIIVSLILLYLNIRLVGYLPIIAIILSLTPFLEMGVGVLRSKNKGNIYLLPAMMFFFTLNSVICFNAIFNILKGNTSWVKTERISTSRKRERGTRMIMFCGVVMFLLLLGSVGATILIP